LPKTSDPDIVRALAFVNSRLTNSAAQPIFRATRIAGGMSNLTYLLANGQANFVLRCSPGAGTSATAHDMAREFRIISALSQTGVPVPRPVLLVPPDIIGTSFYVMEYVAGRVFRSRRELDSIGQEGERAVALSLVDTLAGLHAIDPGKVGLSDFGRGDGYLARQVRRWRRQHAQHGYSLPDLETLALRLESTMPQRQRSTVVHGDFRLENVIVDEQDHSIAAVLDWELATLGDPLVDLASLIAWWDGIPVLESLSARQPGGQLGSLDLNPASSAMEAEYPGRALAADYAAATQLPMDSLPWYTGLCFLKLAVLFEGILGGRTSYDGPRSEFDATVVPQLTRSGHEALDRYAAASA
jgi:aminoglycoside phosphotransferase (APT) family kinase protein